MSSKKTVRRRRIWAILLSLALTLALLPVSIGAAEGESGDTVHSSFYSDGKEYSWDFPYNDEYFTVPAEQYQHPLAQLSLGMALSAFRDTGHPEAQDDYLVAFWEGAGFGEIDTYAYQTEPSAYSIGCGMAQKKIGDATVIAVAVCGGNYGLEWASNLTVDSARVSQGFSDSATLVQEALDTYLQEHPVDGPMKLWIAGYSRGAAVSNITAARSVDAGRFEDVYAYTFATPRTTMEPGDYRSIFNIISKDDPVPKIPMADWGYKRYGIDLFLISPDTDPDRAELFGRTSEVYRKLVGSEMVFNGEINYQIRTVLDYMLTLFPDTAAYSNLLQPVLVDLLTSSDETQDAVQVLLEALVRYDKESGSSRSELQSLIDYLTTVSGYYFLSGRIDELPANRWDPAFGIGNLYSEHFPYKYISRMFVSDNPNEVFSENTAFIRLIIYGNVDAQIAGGDTVIKTVFADGTEQSDFDQSEYSYPKVDCSREKMEISLTADRSYTITLTSRSGVPQTISYTGNRYSGDTVRAQTDDFYSCILGAGQSAVITTSGNGGIIDPEKSDHSKILSGLSSVYSPSTAMFLENNELTRLTIPGLVNNIVFLLLFLLAQLIVAVILAIRRKRKGLEKNYTVSAIWHAVNLLLFAGCEIAMWYLFSVIPVLRIIPMILACIVLLAFARSRYARKKSPEKLRRLLIYAACVVVFAVLVGLFAGKITILKVVMELVLYAAFFAAACLLFR